MEQITDKEAVSLTEESSEGLTIIDFFASWCTPCKNLAPLLEELCESYDIVKADVDECPKAVANYGIRSVPTLVAIKDGNVVATRSGGASKQELQDWLSSLEK